VALRAYDLSEWLVDTEAGQMSTGSTGRYIVGRSQHSRAKTSTDSKAIVGRSQALLHNLAPANIFSMTDIHDTTALSHIRPTLKPLQTARTL